MTKTEIIAFLREHGCPTHYNGYAELVELLAIAGGYSEGILINLKGIYCDTARKYGTTRLCLERNLRTLIVAWAKIPAFRRLFDKIPTNSVFITHLAHVLYENKLPKECTAYDLLLA